MVAEPRNAASEAGKTMTELMLDHERFDEVLAMVADDFVQQDRRKLVGGPGHGQGGVDAGCGLHPARGDLDSRHREVLAVRGDRLVLTRVVERHRDGGSEREFLALGDFDGEPVQVRRTVMFDSDDLDAATAELDRLHAQIEGNGN